MPLPHCHTASVAPAVCFIWFTSSSSLLGRPSFKAGLLDNTINIIDVMCRIRGQVVLKKVPLLHTKFIKLLGGSPGWRGFYAVGDLKDFGWCLEHRFTKDLGMELSDLRYGDAVGIRAEGGYTRGCAYLLKVSHHLELVNKTADVAHATWVLFPHAVA